MCWMLSDIRCTLEWNVPRVCNIPRGTRRDYKNKKNVRRIQLGLTLSGHKVSNLFNLQFVYWNLQLGVLRICLSIDLYIAFLLFSCGKLSSQIFFTLLSGVINFILTICKTPEVLAPKHLKELLLHHLKPYFIYLENIVETAGRQNHYCERLLGKLLNQNFKTVFGQVHCE